MTITLSTTNLEIIPELNAVNLTITPTFTSGSGGGGGGTVESVTSTDNHIVVDNTDQANPKLSFQTVDNENFLTDDELAKVNSYPEIPVEPENKVLFDDGTFKDVPTPSGGYANNLYLGEIDSDVPTYKILTYTADTAEITKTVTAQSSDGVVTAQTFLYPSGVSTELFPSGLWTLKLYGNISATAGISQIGFTYFKRSALGVETDLFTAWSEEINNTVNGWIDIVSTQPSYVVAETDRMGLRLLFKTSSTSNKTLTYLIGDGYAAFLNNPNQIRHSQLRAKNGETDFLHVTQTEKNTWDAKQPAGTYSTDIHSNITALNAVTNVNTGDEVFVGTVTPTGNEDLWIDPNSADVTTADIPDSADKRYQTDYQLANKFGSGANYTQIESDGTIVFNGNATPWDDIDFPLIIKTTGVGLPSLTTIAGNVKGYTYAVNDGLDIDSVELAHGFKQAATTAKFHVHIVTNGVDTTDRYIRFNFEYLAANMNAVMSGTTVGAVDLLIPANTADRTHMIFDIGSYTTLNIGSHIVGKFSRVAAVGTAPTANPFVLKFQLHCEKDTIGSRTITAK